MKAIIGAFGSLGRFIRHSPKGGAKRHLLSMALVGAMAAVFVVAGESSQSWADGPPSTSVFIVQDGVGVGASPASNLVGAVGGQVQRNLGPISAVSASLTSTQESVVASLPGVTVTPDVAVTMQSTTGPVSSASTSSGPVDVFTQQTGASTLWAKGDQGAGVNVAVLDTGIDPLPDFGSRLSAGVDLSGEGNSLEDSYGHGTFVAGLIAGNGASSGGAYTGEAPQAGLVSVKVAGASGTTDLATVIAGVDWTIQNAQNLNIRVLNMSLGFVPFESTTLNPLDQAVEQAWNSGIVVVASAGNAGPFNGTILSPGDDPEIITVGALADNGLTSSSGDTMTPFSSVGPTYPDGWLKPDLVTSGKSVISLRAPGSTVDVQNPSAEVGTANFVGSGTSFSSAIAAGAAALLISAHPNDTPNQVKAAMLASASAGPVGNPLVDGHGALNIMAAVQEGGGINLTQNFGDVLLEGNMGGKLQIQPGDTLQAGYAFSIPGLPAAPPAGPAGPAPAGPGAPAPGSGQTATVQMLAATVVLPVSCSPNGPSAGWITIGLSAGPYSVTSNAWVPASNQTDPNGFEGSAVAPDLCQGATMYNAGAALSTQVNSTLTTQNVQVKFHYQDTGAKGPAGTWSPPSSVSPISTSQVGTTVSLASTWALSTWNSANWKGLPPTGLANLVTGLLSGLTSGSASNGSAWNGSAWNGSAWNGSAWNGSAWNGSAWNGSAWNGSAWNGSAWNGSAWNGSAWNGSAWNGSAWNGSAWN
jgi:serine protease AprX